jgi:hypothetical protein
LARREHHAPGNGEIPKGLESDNDEERVDVDRAAEDEEGDDGERRGETQQSDDSAVSAIEEQVD